MDDYQVTAIIAAICYAGLSKQEEYERGDEPYTMEEAFNDASAIAEHFGLKNGRHPAEAIL